MVTERKTAALKQDRSVATRQALIDGAARVFARLSYGEARLRDIAIESGASEGSMYFHFGTKIDMAGAVLQVQQERMNTVLEGVQVTSGTALDQLKHLFMKLAKLISTDQVVRAGIKLAAQGSPEIDEIAAPPYSEWVRIARSLVTAGVADGSIRSDVDAARAAEFVNSLFVGSQVLAGQADGWTSLPARARRLWSMVVELLAPRA